MPRRRAFTLIEVLISVAIIATLMSVLLPAIGSARDTARRAVCMSNQRQLITAWMMYASDEGGKAMPHLAPGTTRRVYWYGAEDIATGRVIHADGTLSPYLDASLAAGSVFECPDQPDGTYRQQGSAGGFTTTYGYNAYALSPASSGYFDLINRRWPALQDVHQPSDLFVFGDTLLALHADQPSNSALLDPPMLFRRQRRTWRENLSPTTAFRHAMRDAGFGDAVVGRADGSVHSQRVDPNAVHNERFSIGSVSASNDPHYVPDWSRW